jgi:2-methylcitrate dehydratase
LLVRVASAAVATRLLGGDRKQILSAVSNAWMDGGALRAYRHAPNTGSRKSWAAGDATSRGVRLAFMALRGEMGYPSVLSAQAWGFEHVLFGAKPITLARALGSYVMENILFKISFPAEFHAQTAVEAALQLHDKVSGRLDEIDKIEIQTQEAAVRIIDKTGNLANPADRDHCLQYMVAVPLVFGRLTADDYEDAVASDARIDRLRDKMVVSEDARFSREYMDPDKRAIGNALQVFFKDGTCTDRVAIDYPVGHRRRRDEGIPLLIEKFRHNAATRFDAAQSERIEQAFADRAELDRLPVRAFMSLWTPN